MANHKIILVGQAPGARESEPLDGGGGRRLAALAGLEHEEFLRKFDHVNLSEEPGSFDIRAARSRADELRDGWRGRKVVLLDRGVAGAFRLVPDDYEWFQTIEIPPGIDAVVMPYPGGNSTWWNFPTNVERAREFMLRLKLGFVKSRRRGKHRFSMEEVKAALIAGRGIATIAAQVLTEETGKECSPQTIANYVKIYYPDDLENIQAEQIARILDTAKNNVIRAIEAGSVEDSWKLLRSKVGQGSGFELVINAKVDGEVKHQHDHRHRRVDELTDVEAVDEWRRIVKDVTPRPVN